jgi:hypothetical protein
VEGTPLSARENILARVRSAIGRRAGEPLAEVPEPRLRIRDAGLDERIAQFTAALEKLAGKVYVANSASAAADYVRSVVAGRLAIATNATPLRDCGIDYPSASPAPIMDWPTQARWSCGRRPSLGCTRSSRRYTSPCCAARVC